MEACVKSSFHFVFLFRITGNSFAQNKENVMMVLMIVNEGWCGK
jgi:hypothetical protein